MNWNVFWGIYILAFAVGILLVWYFLYYKKRKIKELCTNKITGKIIRYSAVHYNDVSLPVVEYVVNGQTYKVVGPKFKATVTSSFSNPFNNVESEITSNLTTREELPEVLKIKINRNSIASYIQSPLKDLYPIDSEVDVYYNPNNPKMSYVQRFIKPSGWLFNLFLIIGIILLVIGFGIMFGPKINM